MAISERSKTRDLGEFLARHRRMLQPADVGLVARRAGSAGLTQADVAELAGISRQWYVRLEAGAIAAPGIALMRRVATALRLDASASRRLFDLALVANVPALARAPRDPRHDVFAATGVMRSLSQRLSAASDAAEIAECAARATRDALAADFWFAGDSIGRTLVCRSASGRGQALIGQIEEPTNDLAVRGFAGEVVACESVARSGVPLYVARAEVDGSAAFVGTMLAARGVPTGIFGVSFFREREITDVEVALVEAIRSVTALAFR